ncbi:putative membrane-associated kinase regulator 6 [Heracleum sosnowskyi]|uniref:Membrane-associated kinase regulator 6 n=1 Tax=Heracleum sosnowskyi TaxID=360622 RepID=A0AAD8HZ57_9APIA|nr:putative membrane-associated kinase regulator 6 [Heracleum sosnowskyi]
MESSCQSLATESFSYSWLVNQTPQFDGLEEYLTSTSSPRDTNFNFDTSISRSSSFNLVHADEIFSNGHIMPIFLDRTKIHVEALNAPSALPNSIPVSSKSFVCDREVRVVNFYYLLKNWRKSSKRIIRRCFRMLRPLCYKVGCSRKSIRVDDIDRKKWEIRSLEENHNNSLEASPRQTMSKKIEYRRLKKAKNWSNLAQESVPTSPYYSNNVSFEIESSIYEAVLHCKRSFEN